MRSTLFLFLKSNKFLVRCVKSVSRSALQTINENDLIMHCEQFLGDFKSPSKIHFFDELPKGSSGKIQS